MGLFESITSWAYEHTPSQLRNALGWQRTETPAANAPATIDNLMQEEGITPEQADKTIKDIDQQIASMEMQIAEMEQRKVAIAEAARIETPPPAPSTAAKYMPTQYVTTKARQERSPSTGEEKKQAAPARVKLDLQGVQQTKLSVYAYDVSDTSIPFENLDPRFQKACKTIRTEVSMTQGWTPTLDEARVIWVNNRVKDEQGRGQDKIGSP